MSWSFYASGRRQVVAAQAKREAEATRCAGVEETVRVGTLNNIAALCEAGVQDEAAVRVEAQGSAYTKDGVQISNSLSFKFETILLDPH